MYQFPSPLEVDRLFYQMENKFNIIELVFPSPTEVIRLFYKIMNNENKKAYGFRPLPR